MPMQRRSAHGTLVVAFGAVATLAWMRGSPFVQPPAPSAGCRRGAVSALLGGAVLPLAGGADQAGAVYANVKKRDFQVGDTGAYLNFWPGEYIDKKSGCKRIVEPTGEGLSLSIEGEDGCKEGNAKKWKVTGFLTSGDSPNIYFDMSSRGGPEQLKGRWNGRGIEFEAGTRRQPVPEEWVGVWDKQNF